MSRNTAVTRRGAGMGTATPDRATCAVIRWPSMPEVTDADVRELAQLARLALTDDEVERTRGELSRILPMLETLCEVHVDTADEEASGWAPPASAPREDVAATAMPRLDALAGVPRTRDGMVEVPKFKED
ncbi:MAG: Asp-tRNA(Asn)/Glu-tRNA(Gln) amidotransferase subunit GatC [Myxococcales bacterium FL481]|nr:MAG: Asp-tRNA(Asn)/Glu-tRNA(Gln) amidotransferase subunit GatC [Myxococcales bacterium FL481]